MGLGHKIKSALPPVLRVMFRVGQRLKLNITPNHFYSDIPDLRSLSADRSWCRPMSFEGISGASIESQRAFFEQTVTPLAGRFADLSIYDAGCRANGEPGYGPIEALFLHAYIQTHRPRRVVQVGCGVTTAIILAAADEVKHPIEVTCVEPYPTANLRRLHAAGRIVLKAEPAQITPMATFTDLDDGDLLFIDSTHTIKVGSEVVRLMNEVFGRLRPGVRIHLHDITFPYDYNPRTLEPTIFFWRETTLLYARLLGDPTLRIDCSLSMLHDAASDAIRAGIPAYVPQPMIDGLSQRVEGHYPSATYLRKVAGA